MRLLDRSLLGVVAISLLITVLFHINSSLANKDDYRDIFSNEEVDENKIISLLEKTITGNSIINEEKSIFIEPEIYKELEEKDKITVIIKLKDNFNPRSLEEIKSKSKENIDSLISLLNTPIESAAEDSVEPSIDNFEILLRYESLNALAGKINNAGLEIIKNSGTVEAVYGERILHTNLQQSLPLINATQVWNTVTAQGNLTGAGQTVCIVDSGIDYNHQSLGGCLGTSCKVKGGIDFVNMDFDPMDDNGHGTHVAGIVAANSSTLKGVAPNADLIAVKVCDSQGDCTGTAMIAGVDYCISNMNSLGTDIITMSIGDGAGYTNNNCPAWMNFAINFANSMNIPMTVSSGNDAHKNGISYPACAPNVISVGATYDANVGLQSWGICTDSTTTADKVTCFSNSGSNLDLMAPGAIITSTALGGGVVDMNGTSMAAPHIAGTIALIKQLNPTMSPAEIETKLKQNGKIVTDMANGLNFSRIDAIKTVNAITKIPWSPDYRKTFNIADSKYPDIKIDINNNLHIVWADNRDGQYEIYHKKLDNNGNVLVSDRELSFQNYTGPYVPSPSLDLDLQGNVHVVWNNKLGSANTRTYYKKLDNNGNVLVNTNPLPETTSGLPLGPSDGYSPQIDIDSQGYVHIALGKDGGLSGNFKVNYKKLNNNGNLIFGQDIFGMYGYGPEPTIEVDSGGNVHIVSALQAGAQNSYILYTKRDNNGNVLIFPIIVGSQIFGGTLTNAKLALDTQGNVNVVWNEVVSGKHRIIYKKLDNNGNTLIPSVRIDSSNNSAKEPRPITDQNGSVYIFWHDNRNGNYEVYYEKIDSLGNVITDDRRLTFDPVIPPANSFYPEVAKDSLGELHLIWYSNRDIDNELYYKRTMQNLDLEIPQNAIIGTTIPLHIKDIQHPNSYYIIALSYGYSPGILLPDGRIAPLNPDSLLYASITNPQIFTNFQGYLDTNGRATAYLTIPNLPQIAGTTIYAAFITGNATTIQSVSPYFPIQITN